MSTTNTSNTAEQQAAANAAKEANSKRFYRAKHDLFFCAEVIKLAAFAASAHRTLTAYDTALGHYPGERAKIEALIDAPRDWNEFPVGLDWSLNLAQQHMTDAMDTMESAFMAAERGNAEA